MSEAAAAEKPAAPAGGGNKMLLLLVLVVNVLIAGGLAYVVISGQKQAAAPAHKGEGEGEGEEGHEAAAEEEAPEEGDGHAKKGHSQFGPLVEVGTFVANLTGAGGANRYAKVTLHVEAVNEDAKPRLEAAVVPIRNEALLFLSGLSAEQAMGQEKIRELQEELHKRIVTLVGKNTLKRLYFSEFVVQ